MSKYVHDKAAAKQISAYTILNRKGDYVATVRIHYGQSTALANIYQTDSAARKCFAKAHGLESVAINEIGRTAHKLFGFQSGKASGYGYDKATAALSGMMIDGHMITNHCSRDGSPKYPKGRKSYPRDFVPPKGYSLANFRTRDFDGNDLPDDACGYQDCYRDSGLKFLESIGYRIHQAI